MSGWAGPDFERMRIALLRRGKPDRVPICELHVDREVKEAFIGRPIESAADEVAFWHSAGYDFVPLSAGILQVGAVLSGEATQRAQHHYTVYGDGMREVTWAAEGEGVITSREAFERFPWPEPDDMDLSHVAEAAAALPDGMQIIIIIGKVFTATWMLMGMEGFGWAAAFDRELLEAVFERVAAIQFRTFERALQMDRVGCLWMSDDLAYATGLLCSPQILRAHLFPVYKRMGTICRERDVPFALHSDGDLWPVMGDILDCGFCAIHPVEPQAMDAREVKRRAGDRLCLLGNIEVDRLARGTPREIREMVRRNIEDLAYDGGYCVGSSNSVTYYVPLGNYVALLEAAAEFGG